jgi:tetratricopeptide (TPR) repeat protein
MKAEAILIRNRRLGVLAAICFLALMSVARAGDFEAANELFDQGKFEDARQKYESLVAAGQESANLFYNLGNADYRLGSAGRAMLNYERALALDPHHPEARANLQMLRQQSGAKLPALSWFESIISSQSLTVWTWTAAAAAWLTIFSLAMVATSSRAEKGGLWLLALAGVAILAAAGSSVWMRTKDQARAIITADRTEARLAPAESAGVAEALPPGSRVRVLSTRGDWIYCELPGAGRGWVPKSALEPVKVERS